MTYPFPERARVAKATRDAAYMLMYADPERWDCCGIPLNEVGQCQHRSYHPTPFHVAIDGYPERYDEEGTLIDAGPTR